MNNVAEDLDEAGLGARACALGRLLQGGDVLLLGGGMGAGKTTFTRALAAGLGVDRPGRVTSPTFALCLVHPGPVTLVHVDLYRLGDDDMDPNPGSGGLSAAAEALGLDSGELFGEDRVLIVEWAERWISPPEDHLQITIRRPRGSLTRRHLEARASGPRSSELLRQWIGASPRGSANVGKSV
jgi:tRNA threonylcarbamoyladenosine biosynthesis protein TsaE